MHRHCRCTILPIRPQGCGYAGWHSGAAARVPPWCSCNQQRAPAGYLVVCAASSLHPLTRGEKHTSNTAIYSTPAPSHYTRSTLCTARSPLPTSVQGHSALVLACGRVFKHPGKQMVRPRLMECVGETDHLVQCNPGLQHRCPCDRLLHRVADHLQRRLNHNVRRRNREVRRKILQDVPRMAGIRRVEVDAFMPRRGVGCWSACVLQRVSYTAKITPSTQESRRRRDHRRHHHDAECSENAYTGGGRSATAAHRTAAHRTTHRSRLTRTAAHCPNFLCALPSSVGAQRHTGAGWPKRASRPPHSTPRKQRARAAAYCHTSMRVARINIE